MIFSELKTGRSVEGADIDAFRSETKGQRYLYLMAGLHGDEVEGVYVLRQLFDWLMEEKEDEQEIPLVILPILNVDGYRTQSSPNSHALDLEKEISGKSPRQEPECQYLFKLFDNRIPKIVSYIHTIPIKSSLSP